MTIYLLVSALVLLFFGASAEARISANDPSGLAIYSNLDRLEAFGCALPTVRALRPQAHFDLRNSLIVDSEESPCPAPEWLIRERVIMGRAAIQNDLFLRALLIDDAIPLIGIPAQVTPLFPLREGRPTFSGPNVYGEFNVNAEGGNPWGIALSATPGWVGALEDYRSVNGRFYVQEGYLKAGYGRAEVTYGRQALSFGDAEHGNLLLSAATKPLDIWKFALRPGVPGAGWLDWLTFETWIANQGPEVAIPNARLWGTALAIRPFWWMEAALLELLQFGGDGAPKLSTADYLTSVLFSGAEDLDAKRHRSQALHLALWGPSHWVKLYTQFYFERSNRFSGLFSSEVSTLLGLWFPKIGESEIRLEYVHTVPSAYRHAYWTQGLTYQGTPLGHPIGPDGEALYLDFGFPQVLSWRPTLNLIYENRAKSGLISGIASEWRYGTGFEIHRRWERSQLTVTGKYSEIRNGGYLAGQSANSFALYATYRYSFF